MLIQVPSDLGSLNFEKSHRSECKWSLHFQRHSFCYFISYSSSLLWNHYFGSKTTNSIFSFHLPTVPPLFCIILIAIPSIICIKAWRWRHPKPFFLNQLSGTPRKHACQYTWDEWTPVFFKGCVFFFSYRMISRLSVSFPQLTFHDSFVYLANSYWVPSMYQSCPRCWREQWLNRAEILALI